MSTGYAITLAGLIAYGVSAMLLRFVELTELLAAFTAAMCFLCIVAETAYHKLALVDDGRIDLSELFILDSLRFFKILFLFITGFYVVALFLELASASLPILPDILLYITVVLVGVLSFLPYLQQDILRMGSDAGPAGDDAKQEKQTKLGRFNDIDRL